MNKEYKKFMIIIILIVFIFFLIISKKEPEEFVKNRTFVSYSDFFFTYEVIKYPTNITIYSPNSEENLKIGITTDTDNLNFGIIPGNGSYVKRYLNLTNKKEKDAKIIFNVYGNISSLVKFEKNNFILHANETSLIGIYLHTKSAKYGYYSGEIDVIVQRPKFEFLYNFI